MNLLDLYENREPYQQAIDKLEQRRIEDLEAKMDDCARRGDKEGFQKCKAERDSYHKIKETRDTTEKDSQGHVTGFSHEGDWKKIPKNKAGRPVDPRGEVTHLSDLARREAERAAQDDVAEGAGEFLYKKLRPSQYGGVDVVGFKEAPRNSVLSGQVLKHFIDSYETEEEALKAHPDAEGYSNQYTDPQVSLSHLPGEDDPVAGGMYPDDIDEQGMAEGAESSPVAGAIVNRIMRQRPDLLTQYGPKLIMAAADEVADYVGDVDEIGSSDVSGWVNQVERMLKENPPEAFAEAGIGQDLVTPQQRVQGAKSQKQTPTGKVVDTVKQAGKWLAGRGGPGREGPTYEGANDITDRGEYDREGDMAKDNIHTIVRNAKELESILSDNDNLPEWVQDKLANIKGMMTAVSEYMQTQHERDHEEMSGEEGITIAEKLKGLPAKKLGTARDLGKSVRKFRAQQGLEERNAAQKKNSEKVTTGKQVDIKASMLLKRARAAHPLAQSDAEALAMYFLDKEESDVDRLDQVNDREDRMIDRLDQVEQDLQRQIDKLQGHEKLKEGPDLINMSDLQFYKELLAVLIIPVAGLGAAAWNRAQNALKLYRAEDVITALNKKGITVDRATLGQIKPLLLKLEQAIDVDRDGDAAKELAKRIQQTVTWGKLKQTPARSATPVQGRDEPGMAEAANPAQQAAIAIAMKRAGKKPKSVDEESYTGVMQSQGITDPKLLEVACKIDAFAKTIK